MLRTKYFYIPTSCGLIILEIHFQASPYNIYFSPNTNTLNDYTLHLLNVKKLNTKMVRFIAEMQSTSPYSRNANRQNRSPCSFERGLTLIGLMLSRYTNFISISLYKSILCLIAKESKYILYIVNWNIFLTSEPIWISKIP